MSSDAANKGLLNKAALKKKQAGASGRSSGAGFGNTDALDVMKGTEGKGFSDRDLRLTPEFMKLLQSDRSLQQNPELGEGQEEQRFKGAATPDAGKLALAQMGSCRNASLFAAMIALARSNPDAINDIVKDNGDGTYDITLYMKEDVWSFSAAPQIITVDTRFPVEAGSHDPLYAEALRGEEGPELWAMLIEKAAAIYMGEWQSLTDENLAGDARYEGAMAMLTGAPENSFDLAEIEPERAREILELALARGWAVTATARDLDQEEDDVQREAERHTIVSGHSYAPSRVDAKQGKVDMTNPWGAGHIKNMNLKDLKRFFSEIRVVRTTERRKRSPGFM